MRRPSKFFLHSIPKTVWVLGFVSFLTNCASVTITALTSAFIVGVLGGSSATIGYIRGITEAIAYVVKFFSGFISDYIGKRKLLIFIGYACATITKPIFALADSIFIYTTAQTIERVSNGLRDAPRDAMIADCAPKGRKGACFGIRQGFAHAGSAVGAYLCYKVMDITGSNIRLVYWLASIPIFIALFLILFGTKEDSNIPKLKERKGSPIRKEDLTQLGSSYWILMAVVFVFMLSRFTEAFFIHWAELLGLDKKYSALILLVLYLFNMPASKIFGILVDRMDQRIMLFAGFILALLCSVILAVATSPLHVFISVALYGLHYGATQGTFYAMIASYAPAHLKGTSYGVFSLVCAMGMVLSNLLMGYMIGHYGSQSAFAAVAVIIFVSIIGLMFVRPIREDI